MKQKGVWLLISAVICGIVSLLGAFDALSKVRPVTIITVIAGAFGSGAALVSAIYDFKQHRKDIQS